MSARAASILGLALVALVALAPLCALLFAGNGRGRPAGPSAAPVMESRAPTAQARTIGPGCVERPLAYGLTNDQAQGEENERTIMSPFVAHPPVPKPGFYAPGHGPDQSTLFHALYHGYVVVRYSRPLAARVERQLGPAVRHAAQPVVLVAGDRMPFAMGGLVYGRSSVCGRLGRSTVSQMSEWLRSARPRRGPA